MGLVISNSTLSDPISWTSVCPGYKSTKPEAAARVKKRLPISSIIITKINILPSCDAHPKVIYKSQLFLCPGLQAAVSSCLPPLHHHRERWEELQGAGKLLCPLLSLSIFPDPSTAHNWHFLPASQGACKANSHLVLLVRLPNPEHQIFPAPSQYPAQKLFSQNPSWGVSHRAQSVHNYILCFLNPNTTFPPVLESIKTYQEEINSALRSSFSTPRLQTPLKAVWFHRTVGMVNSSELWVHTGLPPCFPHHLGNLKVSSKQLGWGDCGKHEHQNKEPPPPSAIKTGLGHIVFWLGFGI